MEAVAEAKSARVVAVQIRVSPEDAAWMAREIKRKKYRSKSAFFAALMDRAREAAEQESRDRKSR